MISMYLTFELELLLKPGFFVLEFMFSLFASVTSVNDIIVRFLIVLISFLYSI